MSTLPGRGRRSAILIPAVPDRRPGTSDLESLTMRTLIRTAGRFLLSAIFVYSGYGMVNNSERYAKIAAAALPMVPNEPMIARVQGATMLVAGTTLALGFMPKTSARVLALTLIPNTIVGHPFWKFEKP